MSVKHLASSVVYLDSAATTPCHPHVVEGMSPYWSSSFGNPSSPHVLGRSANQVVENCRAQVSMSLNGSGVVVFTSGSTEGNNLGINSMLRWMLKHLRRPRVLCLTTEHKSVINSVTYLASTLDITVDWIPVTELGIIDMNKFDAILDDTVGAVIVQLANSETGVIQDIRTISDACHRYGAVCFSDITQAVGRVPIDLDLLGVDYATFAAHKFYGPKGIGALYVAPRMSVSPLVFGGGQEKGARAGTENVPGIVGMTIALQIAVDELETNNIYISQLRNILWESLRDLGGVRWNGIGAPLLPSHLNATVEGVNAQDLMLRVRTVAFSGGSACNTADSLPSPVLLSMGMSRQEAEQTIRLSVGRLNTEWEISFAVQELRDAITEIRR